MEMRSIGRLTVSVVGVGCNNFGGRLDEEGTRAVVHAALDAGITLFDTADVYGGTRSEEYLGRALHGVRDRVVIATKFGMEVGPGKSGARAAYIERAVEDSLRRLDTDRIDLYQQHRPDPSTPVDETLEALHRLVDTGKVVEIGNSNFSGEQIGEADSLARERGWSRFVCAQNHYSLLRREAEADVLPACERLGLAMLPYFPLASGMLTGKYRRGAEPPEGTRLAGIPAERREQWMSEQIFEAVEGLERFATARGRTLVELAMSWLAGRPTVASVIAGATRPEQVVANARAASWRLDADELAEIDSICPPPLPTARSA